MVHPPHLPGLSVMQHHWAEHNVTCYQPFLVLPQHYWVESNQAYKLVPVVGGERFVFYRGLCILPQQYWGEGNQAYKFVSVAEMAERFKASKHGLAIADHLAQPVQTSDIGGKHHGGENVRTLLLTHCPLTPCRHGHAALWRNT